ncbi:small ribosomal subunit protein mS31 [Odontesthes bonariensis]|uniref:small ribosomal subunit protein mS31 n=1 Tax=Odontesthes bonariensis TaxID=219752 RepID=UPI003F587519
MYRFLSRTVCAVRNSPVCVYDSCALPAKCDKVFRSVNGGEVKAFSTNTVRLCENKDNVIPANQDQTTNADTEGGQTKSAEQKEESVVLKADDGGATQQQRDVTAEQVVAKPAQVKTGAAKSGKENLLDLLGAMKVEVTSKRKLKNLKTKQSLESAMQYKPKPAVMESTISMFQKATEEASSQSETLDPDLAAAASAAASTLPNSSQAESELLRQLRQRKTLTEAQKKGDMNNLGVMIADMKVGKNPSRQNAWPANQIRFDDDGQGYTHDRGITGELAGVRRRRNLFPTKRLNIFSPSTDEEGVESALAKPTLWDVDFANELSLSTNQMPRNGFDEMIQWTKEGKLWHYPINNEIGLEEEASVPFHEHIFLEKHLEEGFPSQGPVRHFMELVVAGLSRNPYLTVQQKKEHIFWFRDYFHKKEDVLNEADVFLN